MLYANKVICSKINMYLVFGHLPMKKQAVSFSNLRYKLIEDGKKSV